jgi:3-oxoadipate enol-lactonase
MPYAVTKDNARLYFEEAGSGTPILFVHEFAADYASWEPQMRYFSRGHRCITYSARGYTPSDVPASDTSYSYEHFRDDAIAVLDHLKIKAAHLVGLSMGAYSSLQVGIKAPERVLSLTLAGVGSGFEAKNLEQFRAECRRNAEQLETAGASGFANGYGRGPGRVAFEVKDPRGYQEFFDALSRHDAKGSAHTMRNFQGGRPPLYEFESEIKRVTTPTLIIVGDEDDSCIESSLYLKKHISPSGLAMFPKTGHVLNLEETSQFNGAVERFIALAEAGRWGARDVRSIKS